MASSYTATARNGEGSPLVSVTIGSIDQEQQIVTEIGIANAVREFLASVDGVESVVVRKYEQVITIV